MIHVATEQARLGNVLVVDAKGYVEAGPFGDVLATACRATGIVSIVIDGRVRDGAVWAALGFPAFARGLDRRGTTKAVAGRVGAASPARASRWPRTTWSWATMTA